MHEGCFRALESGATVITANRRLARVLTQAFHAKQQEQGRRVWNTPDILPLGAFLKRFWSSHVWAWEAQPATLLDELQEQVVWEQVIRESPAGDSLLRIPETAQQVMEAWKLVQAYRLQLDGRFEASEDWAAFAAWARAFHRRCAANNWLEAARLPDVVADLLKSGALPKPANSLLAGFDELTPQQSDFFAVLGEYTEVETQRYQSKPERWMLRDSTAEIRAVAAWARRILEQNPAAQIGIVVPNLTTLRAKVDRIFRETLDPGSEFDDRERSFHVSLGPALDRYPVVNAALLMLEFAGGSLPLPQAGMLLRSPFLGGAATEWTTRAQIDAKLRRDGVWDVSPAVLRDRAGNCPGLARVLARFEKRVRQLPLEQTASEWSRNFSDLLIALEWPGDRTLSSREYQVVEKWHDLLSSLATLDAALPPIHFDQAVSRLRELAAASTFQVENEGAPVQIMGLLEASGLQFDRLWVMGLHDEALPESANPNPFLPISLQRDHKLPHSSAERELEFAMKLMDRLLASARHVVLSYPASDGDRALGPSPVVAGGRWQVAGEGESPSEWVVKMRGAVEMQELLDDHGPNVVAEAMQPGGATLFKDMAACPFRAFAKHRLGARPLERADLGVNKRDQGNAAHKALAMIWSELGNHTKLVELAPDSLRELISRSVAAAIEQLGSGIGRSLERRRLERLLSEWLELEKLRNWFTVQATEQEHLVSLGGLQIRTRADRVDKISNGGEIILDYKTGILKTGGWDGSRPDEPQLPLYCATNAGAEPIAGAAFARIRTGEIAFRGLTAEGVSLPEFTPMRFETGRPFGDQLVEWRRVLERLAQDYGAGLAVVDPKRDACDLCGLRALCRIRELEHDRG